MSVHTLAEPMGDEMYSGAAWILYQNQYFVLCKPTACHFIQLKSNNSRGCGLGCESSSLRMGTIEASPPPVIRRRSERTEKADVLYGQASQSKKGEDLTLFKMECQRVPGDDRPYSQFLRYLMGTIAQKLLYMKRRIF